MVTEVSAAVGTFSQLAWANERGITKQATHLRLQLSTDKWIDNRSRRKGIKARVDNREMLLFYLV